MLHLAWAADRLDVTRSRGRLTTLVDDRLAVLSGRTLTSEVSELINRDFATKSLTGPIAWGFLREIRSRKRIHDVVTETTSDMAPTRLGSGVYGGISHRTV